MFSAKVLRVSNGEGKNKGRRTKQNDWKLRGLPSRQHTAFSQATKPWTFFFFLMVVLQWFIFSLQEHLSNIPHHLLIEKLKTHHSLQQSNFNWYCWPFTPLVVSVIKCSPSFPSNSPLSIGSSWGSTTGFTFPHPTDPYPWSSFLWFQLPPVGKWHKYVSIA